MPPAGAPATAQVPAAPAALSAAAQVPATAAYAGAVPAPAARMAQESAMPERVAAAMAAASATAYHAPQGYAAPPAAPAQPPAASPLPAMPHAAPSMGRMPDAPVRPPQGLPPTNLPADSAAGLQDAISALRGALESRMDGLLWGGRQGPGREPAGAALFRSLLDAGFSTKLVRTLVERLPQGLSTEAALSWARNELVTHLPVVRSEDE